MEVAVEAPAPAAGAAVAGETPAGETDETDALLMEDLEKGMTAADKVDALVDKIYHAKTGGEGEGEDLDDQEGAEKDLELTLEDVTLYLEDLKET